MVATLLLFPLAGCLSNPAYEEGRVLLAKGQFESGLDKLEQAAREEPDNREIRSTLAQQKLLVVQRLLNDADNRRMAGKFAEAEAGYRAVIKIEAANPRASQGLEQTRLDQQHAAQAKEAQELFGKGDVAGAERLARTILAQDGGHREARRILALIDEQRARVEVVPAALKTALDKPVTLEFRDVAMQSVFEVLARTSGVNFVFDKDVKSDAKVTIFIRGSTLDEVVRLILATQQLERKFLNENSILIYPKTAGKAQEYQELVTKTFYLANADVKQAQALVKAVVKSKDTFIDEKLNLLVVKDTADAVRLAERLIQSMDLAEPEVMLEVEVLEISHSKLLDLGLQFPDQIGYGKITPDVVNQVLDATGNTISKTTTFGGTLAPGYVDLKNRSGLTSFVANPALTLRLSDQDGDSNLLANPRIRVRNKQKAKIHIGEKLPIFTTTSSANVGVSSSVSYLDVGLKLDVEPQVYLDDDVGIKVTLEVSSVVKEVPGPSGSIAYEVGTRNADTSLRLKNGETQVLAGLINDEMRSSANKLPGLGDLPLLGRLFSANRDSSSKSEIVLLITPRIIRNIAQPDFAAPAMPAGTETSVGAKPLVLKAASSLSLSGHPTAAGQAPAAPAPVPIEITIEEPAKAEVKPEAPAKTDVAVPSPATGAPVSAAKPEAGK
jgi:general secretion pathway protein D